MNIIEIKHLKKSFGAVPAVDGISLAVSEPGVVALLGPNGAGKTTTLDLLLGLRRPDAGSVRIFGGDPSNAPVRRRIGCAPQQSGVPETLRVHEVAAFVAKQYPQALPVAQTLEAFGLTKLANRQAGVLSGGELRRLTLALAFIGNPDLVVLDEPTIGLDLEARRAAWEYTRAFAARGGSVLLTTHHMEEAEALASRIMVMNGGRIVRDGTAQEIRGAGRARRLVYIGAPFDPAAYGLRAHIQRDGDTVTLATDDADAAVRALVQSEVPFKNLVISERSLEDAVLSLIEEYA